MREREVMTVEREGAQMLEFDGQNACDHFEPVLHPATKPSPSPPPRRGSQGRHGETALSNFDLVLKPETEKRIPANQDVTDCLPKLFEPSIVAVSINEIKKIGGQFFKKSGKQFLKTRKVKKKSGIPPKSGRLTSLILVSLLLSLILFGIWLSCYESLS